MIWRGRDESNDAPPEEGEAPPTPDANATGVGGRVESILDAAERAAVGIREDAQDWAGRYVEESRRKADELASERIKEISALTDNLVTRARQVAAQSDELIAALDEAGRRVINNARPGSGNDIAANQEAPVQQAAPPPPPPPAVQPAPQPPAPVQGPPKTQLERPPAAQPAQPPAATPPVRETPPAPPPARAPEPPPPSAAENAPRVSEGARLLATQMAVAGSTRDEIAWRLREEFGIQDASAILREIGI